MRYQQYIQVKSKVVVLCGMQYLVCFYIQSACTDEAPTWSPLPEKIFVLLEKKAYRDSTITGASLLFQSVEQLLTYLLLIIIASPRVRKKYSQLNGNESREIQAHLWAAYCMSVALNLNAPPTIILRGEERHVFLLFQWWGPRYMPRGFFISFQRF